MIRSSPSLLAGSASIGGCLTHLKYLSVARVRLGSTVPACWLQPSRVLQLRLLLFVDRGRVSREQGLVMRVALSAVSEPTEVIPLHNLTEKWLELS